MNDPRWCPCCGEQLHRNPYEDGDFCWDCGLYDGDPASDCDTHTHARPGPAFPSSPAGPGPNHPQKG